MSQTDENRLGIGGNLPPVIAPTEPELLADLKRRYPKIDARLAEFEEALKSFPENIANETVAKELQDLLGQMKDERSAWKGQRGEQKKPWDKLAKVVMNFFTTAEEKIEGWEATWKPRLDAYADVKRVAAQRAAEAEAQRIRDEAAAQARAAQEAEERRLAAEEAARQAESREAAAREEARLAEERRRVADEAAKAAAEEAKRIEAAKKAKEKLEREQNDEALRSIKRHMKDAARLHDKMGEAAEVEVEQADVDQLDALVRAGGIIGVLAGPVFNSPLLSPEQVLEIEQTRLALGNMRQVLSERQDAKVRRKRAKETKAAEEAEAAAAEQRRLKRVADEEAAEAARKARAEAEAAAEAARSDLKGARKEVTEAQKGANQAAQAEKGAARDAGRAEEEAGRLDSRAGRAERKLENSTDADYSRIRGDLGTVGSQARRWIHYIVDEEALRAASGPLGPFLLLDAMSKATTHLMRARQGGFTGELVKLPDLPGVEFRYERDLGIKT